MWGLGVSNRISRVRCRHRRSRWAISSWLFSLSSHLVPDACYRGCEVIRLTNSRQHFQGLRRAQHKAETNGVPGDTARKVDPTLNPITRRPGPGRGRPRKQPGGDGTLADQTSQPLQPTPQDIQYGQPPPPPQLHAPGQGQAGDVSAGAPESLPGTAPETMASNPAVGPHPPKPDSLPGPDGLPATSIAPQPTEPLGPPLGPEEDDDHGPPTKRQRLEASDEQPEQLHEDEAVLALAAHNGGAPVDPYESEYPHPDPEHGGGLGGDSHAFDGY